MSDFDVWYVHRPLGEPLRAIGGTARLLREGRLDTPDGEVLYVVGGASVDSSCCGAGGCGYAIVQGYVRRWKAVETADGFPMTLVAPVVEAEARASLKARIIAREGVQQVRFRL